MKIRFGMWYQAYATQTIDVPNIVTLEDAIDYLQTNWDAISVPEGEYVSGSDELDVESVEVYHGHDECN